jgi:hypothetical protein
MLVQLLTAPNCPHAEPAAAVVRQALDEAGLTDVPVTDMTIDSQAEADRLGFLGSPTILINGRDPSPDDGQRPALACRLYQHPTGLSEVPPIHPIRPGAGRRRADHGLRREPRRISAARRKDDAADTDPVEALDSVNPGNR